MDELNYLDFDIHIQPSETGYRVKVVNSPAGQASGEFELPFSELEVENFVLRVGRTRKGVRRLKSPEMEAARNFGGRLFEAVFSDELRGNLRSSLSEASQQDAGLRFRLHLEDSPELGELPWEYLYDSTHDEFIVLSVQTPLVRYLDLPIKTETLSTSLPLKILVMISSPSDFPELDVEKEYQTLVDGLGDLEQRGLVRLDRLEAATLANLQRQLRKDNYHIFHFIGHGGYDEQAEDGVLMLEDENGRGRAVSGRYLGTLLHDEKHLRLAMLNACEGARTSSSDPFSGVAHSLVQKGIPAVIAMQFEITDEAAIVLANEFYGAIADGYPVDASLAEARKAIFAQNNDIEWGTPVLYMRSPDGRIFGVDKSTAQAAATAAAEVHVHDGVPHSHAETGSATLAGTVARGADLHAGTPDGPSTGGGQGGGTPGGTAMPGAVPYPEKPKRSIIPWLVGFVGIAALVVAALVVFRIIPIGAPQTPDSEFGSGVIAETDTPLPPPTDTLPTPPTEAVLFPGTGPEDEPTEAPEFELSPTTAPTATVEPTPTEEPTPTVSPTPEGDGRGMIAYASDREDSVQIWTVNVDGSNRRITNRPDGACQPAWSPDGLQLVFISPCKDNQEEYANTALFIIDINGNDELGVKLTEGRGGDYSPSWAPNDLIVFVSDRTNQTSIYTIEPMVGGKVTQLTRNSWNYQPDWSPDGAQIAMVSTRLSSIPKVFIMPSEGEVEGGRAKEFSRGQDFAYTQPRFSPNSNFLMYKKSVPFSTSSLPDLAGDTIDGFGRTQITIATSQSIGPMNEADYSPDGKWIVFEGWRDGEHQIYIMTDFGSDQDRVTEGGTKNFDAAWQPFLVP